jgi:hypothetical protein
VPGIRIIHSNASLRSFSVSNFGGEEFLMGSYKSDYDNAAAEVNAEQTKQVVNQNVTTSEADVQEAREQEQQRQDDGKPEARTP